MAEFERIAGYADPDRLRRYVQRVFMSADLPETDAGIVADTLVAASLRGVDSHGVMRVPLYMRRLRAGIVNPRPELRVVREFGAMRVLDADDGMGQVASVRAIDCAIEVARTTGISYVGVRRSTHFGMAAYYPMRALPHGMIGIAWTNGPPVMVPYGGRQPLLCNNPLACAIPAGAEDPIVVDMAMSVAAGGKIRLAALTGGAIPAHWALAPDGAPTTDPKLAAKGPLLPLGAESSYKGYALALIADILSGVLTGAAFGAGVGFLWDDLSGAQNTGHMFMAINVEGLMPLPEFTARVDAAIRELRSCPPAAGHDRVRIPGEPEFETERSRRQTGIPMTDEILEGLASFSRDAGLDLALVMKE